MNEISDKNVVNVLKNDGVKDIFIDKKYENLSNVNIKELSDKLGNNSWAVRLVVTMIGFMSLNKATTWRGKQIALSP